MIFTKPTLETYPKYYQHYLDLLQENDLIKCLQDSEYQWINAIKSIPESRADYRYAEGKWTVKEVLIHVIDTERILAYRAMRFSRLDPTPQPGFDENIYAPNSNATNRSLEDISEEFVAVRAASTLLFKSMTEEMIDFVATANNVSVTPRSIGFFIAGHQVHHLKVLVDRYLR